MLVAKYQGKNGMEGVVLHTSCDENGKRELVEDPAFRPLSIKVGDKVKTRMDYEAKVLFVTDKKAFICYDDGEEEEALPLKWLTRLPQ